jgi:integrase
VVPGGGPADLALQPDGSASLLVRRSKSDQLGEGRLAYVSPETVALLSTWLSRAGVSDGSLFRALQNGRVLGRAMHQLRVNRILKALAEVAGCTSSVTDQLSGHSMRVGAAQDMAAHGIELIAIMQSGGWKSPEVAARYVRSLAVSRSGMARLRAAWLSVREPSTPEKRAQRPSRFTETFLSPVVHLRANASNWSRSIPGTLQT